LKTVTIPWTLSTATCQRESADQHQGYQAHNQKFAFHKKPPKLIFSSQELFYKNPL
jgi:hypothetical protein